MLDNLTLLCQNSQPNKLKYKGFNLMTASNIHYDFLIVGNGSIGTYTALDLKKKFPTKTVGIIGNRQREGSASVAAGAMANVYAEVESCCESHHELEEKYLSVGLRGRQLWSEFFSATKAQNVMTCEDTIVFLKKGYSEFEEKNFEACASAALRDNAGKRMSQSEIKTLFPHTFLQIDSAIKLIGEFSICTTALFNHLDSFCKNEKIAYINQNVLEVDGQNMSVRTNDNIYTASKIIVAAGSQSTALFRDENIVPMFQGVGTALLIRKNETELNFLTRHVYRSVNRGGAQCGLHCVPRSDGSIYVGAGNYITKPGKSGHRFETVRYLLNGFSDELATEEIGYRLVGDLCHGYRPRSLDGQPIIGCLSSNENIFLATGTNRVGLTWAPDISNQIVKWASGENISSEYFGWSPSRIPDSLMTEEESLEYFCSSRFAAALEHSLFDIDDQSQVQARHLEIENSAKLLVQKIKNSSGWNLSSIHPDNWNAFTNDGEAQ